MNFIQCENGAFVNEIMVTISCASATNGEHRLLSKIIERVENDKTVHIFDVGARDSEFPNFTKKHQLHLFDPKMVCNPEVDYLADNVNVENSALNSTDNTLDAYCELNNINNIEFLKIDTDGYDIDVLKGATKMIKKTKYIQVEYDMFWGIMNQSINELMELLKGFKLYKITSFGLIPKDNIANDHIYSNYLFTNEDIQYQPHKLDADFFEKCFWGDPYIKDKYNSVTHPFCKTKPIVGDDFKRHFLKNYLGQYMEGYVNHSMSFMR